MVEVPDVNIPTTLPNPNALTFTGAATGTYDGSAPLTVNIPEGGGGTGGGVTAGSVTIYDSGSMKVEAGVVEVDTGISIDDLAEFETIVFEANVIAEPWTKIAVKISCMNDNGYNISDFVAGKSSELAHLWEWNRVAKGQNYFKLYSNAKGNGNTVSYPPGTAGTGSYIGTPIGGVAYLDCNARAFTGRPIDTTAPLRFAFAAQTADMNMRFAIIGISKYV